MNSTRTGQRRRMAALEAALRQKPDLSLAEVMALSDEELWAALPSWWQHATNEEFAVLTRGLDSKEPTPSSEQVAEIEAACRARASAIAEGSPSAKRWPPEAT